MANPRQPNEGPPEPILLDGVLDLHMFQPREVKELIPDYLAACLAAGITEVRIIHGKGVGVLRTITHDILQNHPDVRDFRLAGSDGGSWGATLVRLRSTHTES